MLTHYFTVVRTKDGIYVLCSGAEGLDVRFGYLLGVVSDPSAEYLDASQLDCYFDLIVFCLSPP